MLDLKKFQDLLNSDPDALDDFLADPVKALEGQGLVLPDEAKDELRRLSTDAKTRLSSTGSSVDAPSGNAVEIKISIPI